MHVNFLPGGYPLTLLTDSVGYIVVSFATKSIRDIGHMMAFATSALSWTHLGC